MKFRHVSLAAAATVATLFSLSACSSDNTTPGGNGGSSSGGASSGGAASGGKPASGGATGSGGSTSGGAASGGASSGGMTGSGGQSKGGQTGSGGQSSGGSSSGGQASGGGSVGGGVAATFETFKDVVLEKCGGSGCHNDPMNPLQMKYTDTMLYTIVTTHKVAKCSNMLAISPGKPAESAIVKVLNGSCGSISRMPPSCIDPSDASCVEPERIAAITKWVMDGAKQQ